MSGKTLFEVEQRKFNENNTPMISPLNMVVLNMLACINSVLKLSTNLRQKFQNHAILLNLLSGIEVFFTLSIKPLWFKCTELIFCLNYKASPELLLW